MVRMRPLNPAPKMPIGPGLFSLIATEAGRYAQGLQLTCQLWNGTCVDSSLVLANNIAPYVTTLHQQFSLDTAAIERALLDLVVAVEDVLRRQRGPGTGQTPQARLEIALTPEIHDVADQTEAALLQLPDAPLYQRAHRLVCIAAGMPTPPGVTRPADIAVIWPVTAPRLAELAARAARFYTEVEGNKTYCRPPSWLK